MYKLTQKTILKQAKKSLSQPETMSQEPLLPSETSSKPTGSKTFTGIANLIKLLPTGTVFAFQFLNPVVTNNGNCQPINQYLGVVLVAVCAFCCFFSSFTDSYVDKDGVTQYGVVTPSGLWSGFKLQIGDIVHAFFCMLVFGVVVLLTPDSVRCYYPSFESQQKVLLMVLPPIVGSISSTVFVAYPCNRHGIGYPRTQTVKSS